MLGDVTAASYGEQMCHYHNGIDNDLIIDATLNPKEKKYFFFLQLISTYRCIALKVS